MPLVLGWYNPHSGKMFKEKKDYLKHLKKEARARFAERKIQRFIKSRDEFFAHMGKTVKTIPELEQFVHDNWKWFMLNGQFNDEFERKKPLKQSKLIAIDINVSKSDRVSNSHNCPKGGVTNWGGNNKYPDGTPYPKSYPGWQGRCIIRYEGDCYAGWEVFKGTGICTGSGSGGMNSYQFECLLFEDDFPEMTKTYWDNENWKTLGGKDLLENV